MSFQKLLQDTIYNALFAKISSYIYECRESLDVSTYLIQKPKYIRLDDFTIKSIPISNKDEDFIVSDLLVIGYLEIAGYSKYGVDLPICILIQLHPLLDNKTSGATLLLLLIFYILYLNLKPSQTRSALGLVFLNSLASLSIILTGPHMKTVVWLSKG